MALTFTEKDQRAVHELQRALTETLLKANDQKMEAGLAVIALVRCARILLDRYPANTRAALCEALVPFLEGRAVDVSLIIH
jgi:hypothetical protein